MTSSHPNTEPAQDASNAGGGAVTLSDDDVKLVERAIYEVKRVIVGQDQLVERILVGLLARGHILLEGVPGVAKTLAVETFAKVIGGTFSRVQFTPDLVPTDLLGTRIYRQGREEFDTELGPVVANFLLADEINRAPAKVQSALLEVMAERHVSIGGTTYPMPDPFLVMATQNPIENEGVYPLPEAQRDRFLFKILVDYPSVEEEREIVYRMGNVPPSAAQILDPETTIRLQETAANVFVHHALVDYVVRVINATRRPAELGLHDVDSWLSYGASPRATLGIVAAARALALVRGRDYVIPADIVELIPDVLRHRLVLSYDALADEVTADQIINRILQTIGLPQVGTQPVQPAAGPPVQTMPGQQAPGPLGAGPQAPGPQASGPHTAGPNGTPAPGQNKQVNGAQQGRYPGQANQTSARYGG
ncbi:AAA family ATPase [Gordonia otitidis]|uniref:AAA family ATPase n=1 Tax=Gordonia otitidis TaxID=249058 RepID=UPI001D142BE5|nr:MoxR family ATPase [Gordonia otitidis]UEA59117.1 AAA family ATPase [Gordonia otitidis]